MSEIRYRVRNWKKFQHFADRRPPWIRLYRRLIEEADWIEMDPVLCKTLIGLWVVASEDSHREGLLPPLRELQYKLHLPVKTLEKHLLALGAWLVVCDDISDTDCAQDGDGLSTSCTQVEYKTDTACVQNRDNLNPRVRGRRARSEAEAEAEAEADADQRQSGNLAAILYTAPGQQGENTVGRIMRLTGEGRERLDYWTQVSLRLAQHGGVSELCEWLSTLDDAANPATRAAKDIGEISNPATWLNRQATDYLHGKGVKMPRPPVAKSA